MGTYEWKPFTLLVSAKEVEKKMSKFNVGDRVRLKDDGAEVDGHFSHGNEYTVVRVSGNGLGVEKDDSGYYNWWFAEYFEPTAQSTPIRTVTRKEIVAGNYGAVAITKSNKIMIAAANYTAEQLREAAHILNQIAEVLEENGK